MRFVVAVDDGLNEISMSRPRHRQRAKSESPDWDSPPGRNTRTRDRSDQANWRDDATHLLNVL